MDSPSPSPTEIRRTIDEADVIIIKGLALRFRAIEKMRIVKQLEKMPIEDAAREKELQDRWKTLAKEVGLPEEVALLMLSSLLSASKRLQK